MLHLSDWTDETFELTNQVYCSHFNCPIKLLFSSAFPLISGFGPDIPTCAPSRYTLFFHKPKYETVRENHYIQTIPLL